MKMNHFHQNFAVFLLAIKRSITVQKLLKHHPESFKSFFLAELYLIFSNCEYPFDFLLLEPLFFPGIGVI